MEIVVITILCVSVSPSDSNRGICFLILPNNGLSELMFFLFRECLGNSYLYFGVI
jgi:hypothetical protein